jgi:hypothetical protein
MSARASRRVVGALLVVLAGCRADETNPPPTPAAMPMINEVPDSAWRALAATKIFFGHQSVGANILDGIRTLQAQYPRIDLRIIQSPDPASVDGAALVQAFIGVNGAPASKRDAFDAALAHGLGSAGGIAMYKYCFLDITDTTDPGALFRAYRDELARLRTGHPEIRFIHLTSPLTVNGNPVKNMLKRALGKPTAAEFNARRNEYNRLLRGEYEGTEPVFDLARLESTRADGSRQFFMRGPDSVFTLAPELTDDGAHLNAQGRLVVAGQFLAFLAGVASSLH